MNKSLTVLAVLTFISLSFKTLFVRYEIIGYLNMAGVATEIAFLSLIILLVSLLKYKIPSVFFIILNFAGSLLLLTAIMYFDYYNAVFTYKSFAQAGQVGEIRTSIYALFKMKYLLLLADLPLFFFWRKMKSLPTELIRLRSNVLMLLFTANAMYVSWGFYTSSQFISEIHQYEALGFFAYQFLEASAETGLLFKEKMAISPELINSTKPSHMNDELLLSGVAKGKNLIIVQLESVQIILLNKRIRGTEITPNLNQLISESFYFPNFYTQVGKGNTSDAEFLVNSSIYALGNEPMSTATASKKVPSLPGKLKEKGYYTATFHANEISFWSRKEMYETLGFDQYFDQDYFGKEDFIAYGVSDEILYKKTVKKIKEHQEVPFYAHIIALSSHYPYDLPENKKGLTITLPEEYNNSIVGSYIKSVSYADYAFGIFIKDLKESGLYEDSIIIVYGDHQGLQTQNEQDTALVNELLGHQYHSVLDHLNVPLIVKIPSTNQGQIVNIVGGLVDIYPTIANLLGLDISKDILFGTDLINTKTNTIGIRFYAPTGTFVTNGYAFSPGKTRTKGQMINLSDRKKRQATEESLIRLESILRYMELSDEYIRSLK